jgi:hypothetical protein
MVRGITKNFLFSKCRYQKVFFFTLGFQNYIVQMVAVTADTHLEPFLLEWPPLVSPRTEDDV